jgi:hypothetical protein
MDVKHRSAKFLRISFTVSHLHWVTCLKILVYVFDREIEKCMANFNSDVLIFLPFNFLKMAEKVSFLKQTTSTINYENEKALRR